MTIDRHELVIVMLVRILVGWVLIIHAAKQRLVVEIYILVAEPDVVSKLLTCHALLPSKCIVKVPTEIGVIQLGITLCDMAIGINPNPGDAKPAVLAIGQVTYTHFSVRGVALSANPI